MTQSASESRLIAARYTKALFDLAIEAGALEVVEKDLLALKATLAQSEELQRFIGSPVLASAAKEKGVEAVLAKAGAHALTQKFFHLLAVNSRLPITSEVIELFLESMANYRGELVAEVTTATAASAAQLNAIRDALKKALGKDVSVKQKENPAILGGMVVKIGSRMLDNSLAGKLERLKVLMNAKSTQST